ncbi:putative Basic-leucine zipper transcription factor family protein [Hibiscus syriacus]|uniref:Basic-leucine zipper transcription factor family protein n=1 Tax=Hibiscus syriacus TaxID=106335 RepID=A0A6A3ASV2_HIBSY|nr:la-related protein 1C-like [Hibiscus syriacus]KAE8707770.1 putative Basic-leucine zipper transcription factor family protein [Hibiscus syriacus]
MADSNISAVVTAMNHSSISPNKSHRPMRTDSPPWTEIVRQESDLIAGSPLTHSSSSSPPPSKVVTEPHVATEEEEESDENADTGLNDNVGNRPAWNKASKGSTEFGAVMGAHTWPALSESARFPSKSSSDSPRGSFDGSSASPSKVSVSQGRESVSSSLTPQKPVSNRANANSNLAQNHFGPGHQRPMRRNSDNSASNGGLSQPPSQGHGVGSFINNASSRDHTQQGGFVPQSQTGGNDHPHPRNSFRYRNGGFHPRGDGSHHQNFGGRRNQDHGNHEWNGRNFNSRGGHMQPRVAPRLMRHPPPPPPHGTIPFIAHTPMRPFGTPMGYSELTSLYVVPAPPPESFRGMPFVAPIAPVFFPAPESQDSQLHTRIMNQIDYYFSNENLIKDTYLRQHMDEQGWVSIRLIAGFKKISQLTDNLQLITDALQSSAVVEVQDNKVRKRIDWMRWILPSFVQFHNRTGQGAPVASVENLSMEQRTANHTEGTTVGALGDPASDSN